MLESHILFLTSNILETLLDQLNEILFRNTLETVFQVVFKTLLLLLEDTILFCINSITKTLNLKLVFKKQWNIQSYIKKFQKKVTEIFLLYRQQSFIIVKK